MAITKEQKKSWAYSLYMQGKQTGFILDEVGIGSDNTLRKWIREGKWDVERTAGMITRDSLVKKLLLSANSILTKAIEEDTFDQVGDQLAKITSSIERIQPNSVVDIVASFTGFSDWLQEKAKHDEAISLQFLKQVTELQNAYIRTKL